MQQALLDQVYITPANVLDKLMQLIAQRRSDDFYRWYIWKTVRQQVLSDDKNECQWCKAAGFYEAATTVHHINELLDHPELALSRCYIDEDKQLQRNLISLCRKCHEKHHERGEFSIKLEDKWPERW